eukprot:gene22449-biopygen31124
MCSESMRACWTSEKRRKKRAANVSLAAKVQAIKDLPYPNNFKDLKTILGAQHGNADTLSRFPCPTAEDNTGARIDLDSDLYAAFPTVPTNPYVPLDLTQGHIVDCILDVRSVLSICTTPLPAVITYMAQNGITLYEMCGGMCAGLEAALRNGIQLQVLHSPQTDSWIPDLRLAAMSKDTDGLDIHFDKFVLEYLRRGVLGSNWTTSRTRRVLARSRKYRLGASPTGEERIIRILAHGIECIVPAPSKRSILIQRAHETSGHFGARRTAYLVVSSFWWHGVVKQVNTCKICDQAMAYFNQPTATLQSHPIHGLFFAWGIDLSGPYNKTARGNTMRMHAMEYFSAALVVVPISAKEAIHTAYAYSHGVLAHFGAYTLCIPDDGPEFQGKFKEHLLHNFIDHRTVHPNHPQGNGFVERSVGTIKAALTKICSENLATDTWDIDIAKVVTAYNCSPQETTKCAPFTLLNARAPVMNNPEAQLAMTAPLPDLTDSTPVQALTDTLLERAQWIKRVSPTIANHIAIAHHRDTLRYAKIRGGAYQPRLRKFQVGDFVHIRRPNVRNSLQMAAQGMILRIIDLKPTEVVVLQGRCVPVEDWFCPNCKASGITAIPAGRTPVAPQKEPNLFPTRRLAPETEPPSPAINII